MKISLVLLIALFSAAASETTTESSLGSGLRRKLQLPGGSGTGSIDFSGCFSGTSTVDVVGKGPVEMRHVEIGDRVLTASGNFEPVYAFGHHDTSSAAKFVQIQTTNNNVKPLEMTGEHLVFVQGKRNPVRADSIQVGDVLQTGQNNLPLSVSKISTVQRTGLYAPLTPSGNVMVDGIKASTYISLQANAVEYAMLRGGYVFPISQQDLIHITFAPFRMLCMSAGAFCESMNEDGYLKFADGGIKLVQWAENWNICFQVVFLVVQIAALASCLAAETLLGGPALAPLVLAGIVGSWGLAKAFGIHVRGRKVKSV